MSPSPSPGSAADVFLSTAGTRYDKSTSSGTAVSPTGSVGQPATPVNRYHTPRPGIRQRPHSDTVAVQSRVHTITEDAFGNDMAKTPQNSSDSQLPVLPRAARSATLSRVPSVAPRRRDLTQLRRRMEARARSEADVLPSPHHPDQGVIRSRSKSGSSWYERLRPSRSQSNHSSQCSDPSDALMRLALTPLRPPQPPAPEPIHHQVRVETPFTEIPPEILQSSGHASAPESKSSPVYSPFSSLARRVCKICGRGARKSLQSNETRPRTPKLSSKLQLPDHKSLLRRNRPAEALKQVTSILEEISPPNVINPLSKRRTFSDAPGSDSHDVKKRFKHDKRRATGHVSTHALSINRSFPNLILNDSQDSSQLDLRRGPCSSPQNTPEETAIYRVKRSPSAETEEFLKIDISIRGGTSYLPSEARRVHTPPPLQDGLDGRKRGFFFDYNPPKWPNCGGSTPLSTQQLGRPNEKDVSSEKVNQYPTRVSTIGRTSGACLRPRSILNTKKDWYDAKLAELEINSDDEREEVSHTQEIVPHPVRVCSTTSSASLSNQPGAEKGKNNKTKKPKEEETLEEQMDYSIPEHLPTSPLCPRNSRYWRVVQGRGSQCRGCWMHGVGDIAY